MSDDDSDATRAAVDSLVALTRAVRRSAARLPPEYESPVRDFGETIDYLLSPGIEEVANAAPEEYPAWFTPMYFGGDDSPPYLSFNPYAALGSSCMRSVSASLESLVTEIESFGDVVNWSNRARSPGAALPITAMIDEIAARTESALKEVRARLGDIPDPGVRGRVEDWTTAGLKRLYQVQDRLRALRSVDESMLRTEQAVKEVESYAEAAAEAAGTTTWQVGEFATQAYYLGYARRRFWEATVWQVIAFGLLAASLWLSIEHIATVESLDTEGIIRRAVVGIPLLIAAGYCLHEAGTNRSQALWARHAAIQLGTVRAYCSDLLDVDASTVRRALGVAIYAGPPASSQSAPNLAHAAVITEAIDALRR